MKQLRQVIRKLILEGPAQDEFMEMWFNRDSSDEPIHYNRRMFRNMEGTYHKDMFRQLYSNPMTPEEETQAMVDEIFDDKRALKRTWNELVEKYGTRQFWQGPKMKYFHSLTYYDRSETGKTTTKLQNSVSDEDDIADLTLAAFLETYKLRNNRDEMSTYGVYQGLSAAKRRERSLGLLLRGRVTLASSADSFVESRSKASSVDLERHRSSGLPKRVLPIDSQVNSLLFDEDDVHYYPSRGPGECILDNWDVEAIVYDPQKQSDRDMIDLGRKYGLPVYTTSEVFK